MSAKLGLLFAILRPETQIDQSAQVAPSAAGDFTYFDRSAAAISNGVLVTRLGAYCDSPQTVTMKIGHENSTTSYDVLLSQSFSHPGGGYAFVTLTQPYLVPATGTYRVGAHINNTTDMTGTGIARSTVAGNQGVANSVVMTAGTNRVLPTSYLYL